MGLVLGRAVGQSVHIYDELGRYIGRIEVNQAAYGRASLYFDVDPRFYVLRSELVQDQRKDPAPDSPASRGSPTAASANDAYSDTGSPDHIKRRRTA